MSSEAATLAKVVERSVRETFARVSML